MKALAKVIVAIGMAGIVACGGPSESNINASSTANVEKLVAQKKADLSRHTKAMDEFSEVLNKVNSENDARRLEKKISKKYAKMRETEFRPQQRLKQTEQFTQYLRATERMTQAYSRLFDEHPAASIIVTQIIYETKAQK